MPAATRADPELVGRPRHPRTRVAHFHLGATALTSDVKAGIGHDDDSTLELFWSREAAQDRKPVFPSDAFPVRP
jgi:hypothetical protein